MVDVNLHHELLCLALCIGGLMETISVRTHEIDTGDSGLPLLVVQVTELVDTYMIWVGVKGAEPHLAKDWACAMPPLGVCWDSLLLTDTN